MEIRDLTVTDSKAYLDLLLKLDNETKFMMLEPGERDTSLDVMEKRLLNNDDTMSVYMGAFIDDELVGFISLWRGSAKRARHSAYIVMGITSSYTGRGIGKLLLGAGETWAKKNCVCRLEMTVMTHNINAINLYERFGFSKEGTKKKSLLVDGCYVDEYYMSKILGLCPEMVKSTE